MTNIRQSQKLSKNSGQSRGRSWIGSSSELFLIGMMIAVFFLVAVATVLFFILQTGPIESRQINQQIEKTIQTILGPNMEVSVKKSYISLGDNGLFSLTSESIELSRANSSEPGAYIKKLSATVKPLSLLTSKPIITKITIETILVQLQSWPMEVSGQEGLDPDIKIEPETNILDVLKRLEEPQSKFNFHIEEWLGPLRQGLLTLNDGLTKNNLESIELKNVTIKRNKNGQTFRIPAFSISRNAKTSRISFNGRILYNRDDQPHSDVLLNAEIKNVPGAIENYPLAKFVITGIPLSRLWAGQQSETGQFLMHGMVTVELDIPLIRKRPASQAYMRVTLKDARFQMGENVHTTLEQAELNIRLIPGLNQIELEPSSVIFGNSKAILTGKIRPKKIGEPFNTPLILELTASPVLFSPIDSFEKSVIGKIYVSGIIELENSMIKINNMTVNTSEGSIFGSGSAIFINDSPSLALAIQSNGISTAALKQIWPIFLAPDTRKWVQENLTGGSISNLNMTASIPSGILGYFSEGRKMTEDQFSLDLKLSGIRFDSFAKLPAIRDASGIISLRGMFTEIKMDKGTIYPKEADPVQINAATLIIDDFEAPQIRGHLRMSANGNAQSIAAIADYEPIEALTSFSAIPEQFSGLVEADVTLDFPFDDPFRPGRTHWNVLLQLKGVASNRALFGHKVLNANCLIDASNDLVKITGKAKIDGIATSLDVTIPTGKTKTAQPVIIPFCPH